jgi:hypothetical protein
MASLNGVQAPVGDADLAEAAGLDLAPAPEAGNPAARAATGLPDTSTVGWAPDAGLAAAGVGGAAVLGAWWARRRHAVAALGAEASPPE